jgi:hypothetical protein
LVLFTRDVPGHNPFSVLYEQCYRPHGLVFALTCTVKCETLYQQVCVFQIMSNQLNLSQVDSNQIVERMTNGNRMYLSSISNRIAKGLNTYVNKVFLFYIFNTFAKLSKILFSLCHYGYCV